MTDFSRFISRYEVSGTLRLLTPVRIGAQKSTDVVGENIPVIKDATGNPIIPGSSLKGVLRAYTESVLRTLQDRTQFVRQVTPPAPVAQEIGARRHVLVTEPMTEMNEIDRDDTVSVELVKAWKAKWQEAGAELTAEALDQFIIDASSMVQQVFGAPWLASKVHIRDSSPVDDSIVRTIYRDGVGIDRDRRTAQDGFLYSFEAVPAGAEFDFRLVAENLTPKEMGLLLIGIKALQRGDIALGGGTTRGLGEVVLVDLDIRYVDAEDFKALIEYLATGTLATLDAQALDAYFQRFMQYIR